MVVTFKREVYAYKTKQITIHVKKVYTHVIENFLSEISESVSLG